MAKGKYYTPEFKEQAVKMAAVRGGHRARLGPIPAALLARRAA